jgi:hypothetical membrane protein
MPGTPWTILIGFLGEMLVPILLAWRIPGYSHTKNVISELGIGTSPVNILMNTWLILFGIILTKSRILLLDLGLPLFSVLLVYFYGVTCIIDGVFPLDMAEEESLSSRIHGVFGGLGFLALTGVPFSIWYLCEEFRQLSIVFSLASLSLLILFIGSKNRTGVFGLSGLLQRGYLLVNYLYLTLLVL